MSCLLILQTGNMIAGNVNDESRRNTVNEVRVSAVPETQALTSSWVESFRLDNPEAGINMVAGDESESADISIISDRTPGFDSKRDYWKIVVGRDVLVPVMDASDPYLESVLERGISPAEYASILTSDGKYSWGTMPGTGNRITVSAVIPEDDAALNAISAFAGIDPAMVRAVRLSAGDEIAAMDRKPGTIVFCRLADISTGTGTDFINGIIVIPVDINGNGRSDYFEQFYESFESFTRGVYIGKFPKSLCSNIYAVAPSVPAAGAPTEFVSYILADGQRLIALSGFTALAQGEGAARREALATASTAVIAGNEKPVFRAWLWVLAIITAVSAVAWMIYGLTRAGASEEEPLLIRIPTAFSPKSLVTPAGILYDRGHAWSFREKDGTVKVGIDDFLQHLTGSITRINMKVAGDKISKGEHLMSIVQNGKKLDIHSPVSGTIIGRNELLTYDTTILHSSPYDNGWVYSVEPDNWENESRLMSAAGKYAEFLREEFSRIKDFLAGMPGVNEARLACVVLQDGGELREGLLEEFGPEIWEEFQMRFIDSHM